MTTIPDFVGVVNSIAALSVPAGVHFMPWSETTNQVWSRNCPMLLPDGVESGQDERSSVGAAGGGFYIATFRLAFWFFWAEVGLDRADGGRQTELAETALSQVIDAVRQIDTTATSTIQITWAGRGKMGVITEPGGQQFLGCPVSFDVRQFYNQ